MSWKHKLRSVFGVTGVSPLENERAQEWGKFFKIMLIPIMMALLFQHYLFARDVISLSSIAFNDWFLSGFFIFEEILLLLLVNNKKRYFLQNWLNIVIIMAVFPPFWYDVLSLFSIPELRLLMLIRLAPPLWDAVASILFQNSVLSTLIVTIVISALGGEFITLLEPSIKTPWDGIWFAWETLTTTGYGDIIPHTTAGRIVTVLLMIIGVILTSLLTANFATYILDNTSGAKHRRRENLVLKKLEELEHEIKQLKNKK